MKTRTRKPTARIFQSRSGWWHAKNEAGEFLTDELVESLAEIKSMFAGTKYRPVRDTTLDRSI